MADYGSLRFVDKVGKNFLFRGGAPVSQKPDGTYMFDDGLFTALSKAPNLPTPLPSSYYTVIMCLLQPPGDDQVIAAERTHFSDNPAVGQFNLWATNGTPRCYFHVQDPLEREFLLRTMEEWLDDPLIWRVATLRRWLETSQLPVPVPDKPLVFYVHCSGGCDRTGEMIGGYRLRCMDYSWLSMWQEQPCNFQGQPRPMGCNNYRALQWYAYWLNATLGFSLSGMGEGGCYDPGIIHRPCSPLVK
jgi:hypothetical protein